MDQSDLHPADGGRYTTWIGWAARGSLALLLMACLAESTRQGVANWLGGINSQAAIQQAQHWDGANPEWPEELARVLAAEPEADPQKVALAFKDATRLGPQRAENWAGLGEALDLAGDFTGARRAYEQALDLFPRSPAINWQFANLLIRAGNAAESMAPLHLAIAGDPGLRVGAFDLAWRAGIPGDQILMMLPAQQEVFSAYLDYLAATGRLDAARAVWQRLLASPGDFDLDAAFRYFDALMAAHRVSEMTAIWGGLAQHDPNRFPGQPRSANLVNNGGFEEPICNGGFGWRVTPIDGADVSFDTATAHDGGHSLLLHFEGKLNLDFAHVAQYAPVEPNAAYRFIAYTRSDGITTDSGPRIGIYDPFDRAALSVETANTTGSQGWQEQRLEFRTGPNTQLVVIQVVRPPSRKLDNQIAGTLWLDDVSLSLLPPSATSTPAASSR